MLPQSASAAVAFAATGCPNATTPLTDEPVVLPVAEPGVAVALARASTLEAVISPPKTERELTSAAALAVAFVPATADTLAFAEPVVTSGLPSAPLPYVKPPLNWTASGGAESVGVAPPA